MEREERNLSEVNCVAGVFAKFSRRKVGRDQQVKKKKMVLDAGRRTTRLRNREGGMGNKRSKERGGNDHESSNAIEANRTQEQPEVVPPKTSEKNEDNIADGSNPELNLEARSHSSTSMFPSPPPQLHPPHPHFTHTGHSLRSEKVKW